MARSKREIPHYYLETRVDMSRALAWLRGENERRPVERRLLPAVVLLKAVARALAEVPDLNGFWIDETFRPGAGIHIGMAIGMKGGGLVAPALHDVDARSYDELMADLHDLIPGPAPGACAAGDDRRHHHRHQPRRPRRRARAGRHLPAAVALVGFGRITEQPWAEGGIVEARPVVWHRSPPTTAPRRLVGPASSTRSPATCRHRRPHDHRRDHRCRREGPAPGGA